MAKTEKNVPQTEVSISSILGADLLAELTAKFEGVEGADYKGHKMMSIVSADGKKAGYGEFSFSVGKAEKMLGAMAFVAQWYMDNKDSRNAGKEEKEIEKKAKAYAKLTDCTLEEALIWAKGTFKK